MNKLTIAGIAAVAAVAIAIGGWFYVQNRAKGEVDAAFAALRSSGMKASYTSVAFDPFGRSLTVGGISIADQSGGVATIAKATAGGIDLGSKDFSARTVAVNGAEFQQRISAPGSVANATAATPTLTFKFDQASATAVRIGPTPTQTSAPTPTSTPAPTPTRSPTPATPATASAGQLGQVAAAIQALDIGTISVPKLDMVTSGEGASSVTAITSLDVSRFRDGRIGTITAGSATMAVAGADGFDLTTGPITLAEHDIIATLGVRNAKALVRDGQSIVQGPFTAEQIKVKTTEGQMLSADRLAGDGVSLGPNYDAERYRNLFDDAAANAVSQDGAVNAAKVSALMNMMAGLYADIGWGPIELQGITFGAAPGATVKTPLDGRIALLRMGALRAGVIEEIAIEGASTTTLQTPTQVPAPVEIKRFAFKGIAIAEFYKTMSKFTAAPSKPQLSEQLLTVAGLIRGIDARGVDVTDPKTGAKTTVKDFQLSWGKNVNGIPTDVKFTGAVDLPLDATKPEHAALMQRGFKVIPTAFDVGAVWSEADKTVSLSPGNVELSGLGAIRARLKLGNVPREVIGLDQAQFMAAMLDFEVQDLSFDLADQGAMQSSEAERAAIAMQIAATRAKLSEAQMPAPSYLALMTAVEQFTASTGKTLSVRFAPRAPVALVDLLAASQSEATLAALLDGADFQASVK